MNNSDQKLITLLREQPTEGMAALYDAFGRLVFSVALRIVEDHGAAEEITQDVFLRFWHHIDQYRSQSGSLATWLASIARNRAIDELRSRRGREARREISNEFLSPMSLASPIHDVDDVLTRHEIQAALLELPASQREVIALAYWGGLTRREIAEQLEMPLGTVQTRLRLAMERLRHALEQHDSDLHSDLAPTNAGKTQTPHNFV